MDPALKQTHQTSTVYQALFWAYDSRTQYNKENMSKSPERAEDLFSQNTEKEWGKEFQVRIVW